MYLSVPSDELDLCAPRMPGGKTAAAYKQLSSYHCVRMLRGNRACGDADNAFLILIGEGIIVILVRTTKLGGIKHEFTTPDPLCHNWRFSFPGLPSHLNGASSGN